MVFSIKRYPTFSSYRHSHNIYTKTFFPTDKLPAKAKADIISHTSPHKGFITPSRRIFWPQGLHPFHVLICYAEYRLFFRLHSEHSDLLWGITFLLYLYTALNYSSFYKAQVQTLWEANKVYQTLILEHQLLHANHPLPLRAHLLYFVLDDSLMLSSNMFK